MHYDVMILLRFHYFKIHVKCVEQEMLNSVAAAFSLLDQGSPLFKLYPVQVLF